MTSRRPTLAWRVPLSAAMLSLALVGIGPTTSPAVIAASPVHLSIDVGVRGGVGGTAPDGRTVHATLRSTSGRLKGSWAVVAVNGRWSTVGYGAVMPGDVVLARMGDEVREIRVPHLTVKADRVMDRVWGEGPAGVPLKVRIIGRSASHDAIEVTVGSSGRYATDLSRVGIVGRDSVRVVWTDPDGDRAHTSLIAPFVAVRLRSADVSGAARPFATRTVTLRDTSRVTKGTATVHAWADGSFSSGLVGATTVAVVRPGDRIEAIGIASDARFTVPHLRLRPHALTDTIDGTCPSRGLLRIQVERPGTAIKRRWIAPAPSTGSFHWDLSRRPDIAGHRLDLRRGDVVTLTWVLPAGDEVSLVEVVDL